ncbi:MAG: hypothetical protein IKV10_00225 [Alphaproteobacteria bacterium]|nr:hypothetical protein [Alphaproteobacteria bacterium]
MSKILTYFARYVKNIAFFMLIIACAGCASKSATDSIMESVEQQIVALEKTLPAECKTEAVKADMAAIKSGHAAIKESCHADVKKIEAERDKWATAFFALAFVLGWLIVKKVEKHV